MRPLNSRFGPVCCVVVCLGLLAQPVAVEASKGQLVRSAGTWLANALAGWAAGKAFDRTLAFAYERDLDTALHDLLERLADVSGSARDPIEDQIILVERQLALFRVAQTADREVLEELRREQDDLIDRVDAFEAKLERLEGRTDELEGRTGALERRMAILEDAMIAECLDLRHAPRLGAAGFHVEPTTFNQLVDSMRVEREWSSYDVSLRASLDACTPDLSQRGLLLQLSLVTRDATGPLSLYLTYKDLRVTNFDPMSMNHIARDEWPLARPVYAVDGQVQELFVPYADFPLGSVPGRFAVAFVLTDDGQPVYSLPDTVIQCSPGRQLRCRWLR